MRVINSFLRYKTQEITSQWVSWLILGGILLLNSFPQLLLGGIILFAMTTLFSFITLPVEIDASKRALVWLSSAGITNSYNHAQAEDALKSAAYTYVVAALGSLAHTWRNPSIKLFPPIIARWYYLIL